MRLYDIVNCNTELGKKGIFMEKEILQVNMFGEFSLTYGGATIDDSGSRSKKLWTLLEYLLVFRDREITQNELIELLKNKDKIMEEMI